ncbi:unnamed protein product [Triticum turgidum subsp. durum]|uniref:Amino acid transporter transmembrane domain-containing protein n=1 Tax=Triticum turgidum subsp. durum TaxID=4567 RepID=A0A9R0W046_TRITD|nr:unnamed protein product [Triticum turgidum subsp. durum]
MEKRQATYGKGAARMAPMEVSVEAGNGRESDWLDDDGRPRRSGTVWTASAHIITAVIGSGVLSLAWAIAQLGWVAGPAIMLLFALVIYYTSTLLAECYRSGDPETGKRNYTYMIVFGVVQILFSQIPDFDQIWWLSIVAAVMSFTYSTIGLGLGIAQTVANGIQGSLTGLSVGPGVTSMQKVWRSLQAFGNIAFAYSYSIILIEIQTR